MVERDRPPVECDDMDGALRAALEHKTIVSHGLWVHANLGFPVTDRVIPPITRAGIKLNAVRVLFFRLGMRANMNTLAIAVKTLGLRGRDLDGLHGIRL